MKRGMAPKGTVWPISAGSGSIVWSAGCSMPVAPILATSAVMGLVACFLLFEAAEHGGDVVYSWAGGVGTRSGDSEDLERLLLAGLYHRSIADRAEGRAADAAALTRVMTDRFGDQCPDLRLLGIESLIHDLQQPREALAELADLSAEILFARYRKMWLTADAYEALGLPDSALITLEAHEDEFDNGNCVERLAALESAAN